MTIRSVLDDLVRRGVLIHWSPSLRVGDAPFRCIYLTPSVHAWLEPPTSARRSVLRRAIDAKTYLKTFLSGGRFDDLGKLKNLDVDDLGKTDRGIHEIKIRRHPEERVFGGFPEPNLFVGTHVYDRATLPRKEWVSEKNAVLQTWGTFVAVFPGANGLVAERLPLVVGKTRAQLTSNIKT